MPEQNPDVPGHRECSARAQGELSSSTMPACFIIIIPTTQGNTERILAHTSQPVITPESHVGVYRLAFGVQLHVIFRTDSPAPLSRIINIHIDVQESAKEQNLH